MSEAKSCKMQDFMEELKPWLDRDHIHRVVVDGQGRLTLYFSDGMRNVYAIDDCAAPQLETVLATLGESGIPVEKTV